MRNLIINRIGVLQKDKQELKLIPSYPTEVELKKDILNLLHTELDSLIGEGRIIVTGVTINQQRIIRV